LHSPRKHWRRPKPKRYVSPHTPTQIRHFLAQTRLHIQLQASRFLLTSYLGAVYYRRGLSPIQAWIDRLIDPDGTPAGPQQPPNTPPALPHSQIHHSPQNNSLSAFNQQCGQIGYSVEWPAESNGPAHALRWSVKCMGGRFFLVCRISC
jgi:dsRNA-specific ribonuclease